MKKKLFVDVHTTIKPFVRILVRYLNFRVEINSWSKLDIFVHGLINSFCLMNGLDSWKSFTFNKCILQSLDTEVAFRANAHSARDCYFLLLFFWTSTNTALANFCIPLLCNRTWSQMKMFSFPRTNIKLFFFCKLLLQQKPSVKSIPLFKTLCVFLHWPSPHCQLKGLLTTSWNDESE